MRRQIRLIGPITDLDGLINVRTDAVDISEAGPAAVAAIPISRVDGRRTVTISGVITAQDTRAVNLEIDRIVAEVGLPPGVEQVTGGVFSDIEEVFTQMIIAMGIGALLVYVVMFLAQRSLITPFIIVLAVPLAFTGAIAALFITGRTLSLPGLMGLLMLIGLVVTNAVVLIAFVDQLRARGLRIPEALVQGGQARIRPILMTALTTSIVLSPLAFEEGGSGGIIGAELGDCDYRRPDDIHGADTGRYPGGVPAFAPREARLRRPTARAYGFEPRTGPRRRRVLTAKFRVTRIRSAPSAPFRQALMGR